MEVSRIADFTVWPSHDSSGRIDFGNSNVEVITTLLKDICENSDVTIDDALTEWNMMKYSFYRMQVKAQANININHTILFTIIFVYLCIRSTYNPVCLYSI